MQRVERETADPKICLEIGPWNFFQNYKLFKVCQTTI